MVKGGRHQGVGSLGGSAVRLLASNGLGVRRGHRYAGAVYIAQAGSRVGRATLAAGGGRRGTGERMGSMARPGALSTSCACERIHMGWLDRRDAQNVAVRGFAFWMEGERAASAACMP